MPAEGKKFRFFLVQAFHLPQNSKYVHLEMPQSGGHVGFVQFSSDGSYWSEQRAVEFLGQAW